MGKKYEDDFYYLDGKFLLSNENMIGFKISIHYQTDVDLAFLRKLGLWVCWNFQSLESPDSETNQNSLEFQEHEDVIFSHFF